MHFRAFLAFIALACGASLLWLSIVGVRHHEPLNPNQIQHAQVGPGGFAYYVSLSFGPWSVPSDGMKAADGSSLIVVENGTPQGPAHAEHVAIAERGHGRFSHWGSSLYFSSSDGTDPRTNGRAYSFVAQRYLPSWVLGLGSAFFVLSLWLGYGVVKNSKRAQSALIAAAPTLQVTAVALGTVAAFFGIGEAYLRLTTPFAETKYTTRFDPKIGFLYEPSSPVQITNGLDYWTKQQSNSIGFLDRPPPGAERRKGRCHIAFIGDSFVEAIQVAMPLKFQVVLENIAKERHPDLDITTSAFGYAGTGQLNQLPFYDLYARGQKPNIVVLVFVSNDIPNNSALLEAIRNGWDPDFAPRVYAERTANGFQLTPIHPDWRAHLLAQLALKSPRFSTQTPSLFWNWIAAQLNYRYQTRPTQTDPVLAGRMDELAHRPKFANLLATGRPASIASMDGNDIRKYDLAPPFAEAYAFTEFALSEFKRRTQQDGAKLIVFLTHSTDLGGKIVVKRVKDMVERVGLPIVDQAAYIRAKGGRIIDANFPHDGHWSPQGHRWAAEAMMDYIDHEPELCEGRAGISDQTLKLPPP